jgi:hypothetical protein
MEDIDSSKLANKDFISSWFIFFFKISRIIRETEKVV